MRGERKASSQWLWIYKNFITDKYIKLRSKTGDNLFI
jgi:hypothetical protein